ncbi:histidine phosphatase family protein [Desulforhopalus sp. 52FAK]
MDQQLQSSVKRSLFGLLRHGETEWNTQKKIQGLKNSPLTPWGISQTRAWLPTLQKWDWDQIYASDLGRVKQTVALLNEGLHIPFHFDVRLREQNWGDWEGRTIASIRAEQAEQLKTRVARGWDFSAPGGETRASVRDRVFTVLKEIADNSPGKKTLIVCHQGIIKAILYHLSNRAFLPEEDSIVKANNLHLITHNDNIFTIDTLNIERGARP